MSATTTTAIGLRYSGGYKIFYALSVSGVDEPESLRFNGIGRMLLDGTLDVRVQTVQRLPRIDLGVQDSYVNQAFLYNWALASDKAINYLGEEINVVLADPAKVQNAWENDCERSPHYVLDLIERDAWSVDVPPASWDVEPGGGEIVTDGEVVKTSEGEILKTSDGDIITVET